jgi:release factor glutamine methyltransferase
LALLLPQTQVYATDLSPAALEVARLNADNLHASVNFTQGNLLLPLAHAKPFDLIVANLPYIRHDVLSTLSVAEHEPHLALDGGEDGLVLIRELLQQAVMYLKPTGGIFLEIGADQGRLALNFAKKIFPLAQITLYQDYAKLDRMLVIQDKKMAG